MILSESLRSILSAAILAPSGENSQPWRFKIKDDHVELWNNQESDLSFYNFNQYGSYVAHGAAIENILIAASSVGYEARIELFPEGENSDFVALIKLVSRDVLVDPLSSYIKKRITNRKAYDGKPLLEKERDVLTVAGGLYQGKLIFEEDKENIQKLAEAGSANEIVMLGNHFVHNFFFSHVRWTAEEDKETPNGFYVKTLELAPPQVIGFKLFRSWRLLHILNKIGVPRIVAKENAKVYGTASAFGVIAIPKHTPEFFVEAGRKLQRIWLTATEQGLWIQPISGAVFLANNLLLGEPENFSGIEAKVLKDAQGIVREIFKLGKDEVVAMMFRVGRGDPPSAQSSRFSLESFILKE